MSAKKIYRKGGTTNVYQDLCDGLSAGDIERIRNDIHNVLWGGGTQTDTDVFNLLVRLIIAKIQDEQSARKNDVYKFQIMEGESLEDVLPRVDFLYRECLVDVVDAVGVTETIVVVVSVPGASGKPCATVEEVVVAGEMVLDVVVTDETIGSVAPLVEIVVLASVSDDTEEIESTSPSGEQVAVTRISEAKITSSVVHFIILTCLLYTSPSPRD